MPNFSKCLGDSTETPPPYETEMTATVPYNSFNTFSIREKCARKRSFLPGKVMLFGRNEIINKIVYDLTQTEKRCIVLEGAPGCGKTAVAVSASHDLIEKGIICSFVDLRLTHSSKDIMQAILTSLHHTIGGCIGQSLPTGKVFEILQCTEEERVLMFDNAEDCLKSDEMKEEFVEIIKKVSMFKNVKSIITSRVAIKVCEISMTKHHLSAISKEASVSILTNKVPISILLACELSHECGYIPLALQVIAALIEENVTAERILKSLKKGKAMKILSPDFRCNIEKLMSCISTSYHYLDSGLRCGFSSLAVFPQTFCITAAAAVLGTTPEDARTCVLNPLRRRNLLEYDAVEERWKFHVLLRNFALEVRKKDKTVKHLVACQTYLHRFCSYFVKFMQEASQTFSSKTLDCLKKCQGDVFNIQETLKLASDSIFAPEFSCLTDGALGKSFGDLLNCVISVEDQISFYEHCIVDAQRRGNLERECVLLCRLAAVYISSVNCTFVTLPDGPGIECLERILKMLENLDLENSVPLARCLAEVGHLEAEVLQFDNATKHLKTALAIQERNGDDVVATACTLTDIGNTEMCNSHSNEANFFLHKAHVILENYCKLKPFTLQSSQVIASLANNKKCLGHLYLSGNQLDDALKMFHQANDICQMYAPNHPNRRFTLDGIAHCYLRMNNYEKALEFYEKVLELRKNVVEVELPVNVKIISYVYFEMGMIEKSFKLEREIMSMWERSMQNNLACAKLLQEGRSKNYVATVFYALVLPHERREIETFIFEKPPTTREIRIQEFANAMWSSEFIAVMHLEPERYEIATEHLMEHYTENVIGENSASDKHDQSNWDDMLKKAHSLSAAKDAACLLIMRPIPTVGKESLQLLPVTCHKNFKSQQSKPVTSTNKINSTQFCIIL